MAHTIQTHELISFSIQDWMRGQRWGDAVAGDVEMDWTRLPSGGKRPWFLCPSCSRRCGVLYSLRSRIICRKCGGLSYESQNEPRHFRALRKAQKIRVRLGGSANMTEPFPSRPRYMHRRTYQRLRRQYEAAVEQYVGGYGVAASNGITVMGVPLAPGGAVATSRE